MQSFDRVEEAVIKFVESGDTFGYPNKRGASNPAINTSVGSSFTTRNEVLSRSNLIKA